MHKERTYIRFMRYAVQFGFVLLTLFIGYRFYQFVRHFEVPGSLFVRRPASVDAFLPIGGLMAFKYFLFTGIVEPVHPSGQMPAAIELKAALRYTGCQPYGGEWPCRGASARNRAP